MSTVAINTRYLCIPLSSLFMPCASARTIERRPEIVMLTGAMKRMLILAVTLWLGVSATAHAQVNSPTDAASAVTGAIVPSGQGVNLATGGGFSPFVPLQLPCPFGLSLSAVLTAFGCASDPLGAPTYQISAGAVVVMSGPAGSISATRKPSRPAPRRARVVLAALPH